ncbi:MAG: hypothetical protein ACK5NK_00855 [Niabella sp.]
MKNTINRLRPIIQPILKVVFLYIIVWAAFSCNNSTNSRSDLPSETDTVLEWVDYRYGELPPQGYYDALDSIIKKWDIRYKRIEGGCEADEAKKEQKEYEKNNSKYFHQLEHKFGKNWRNRFDAEVAALDSLLKTKKLLNPPEIYTVKYADTEVIQSEKHFDPDINCSDKGGSMEDGFVTECIYKNYSLKDAYNHFREKNKSNDDGKYLEEAIPVKKFTKRFNKNRVTVVYNIPNKDMLQVELLFDGGTTSITFKKDISKTIVTAVY